MGGYRSGRWHNHSAKQTVEESLVLPITHLKRLLNKVEGDNQSSANSYVSNPEWSRGGKVTSRIGIRIESGAHCPLVHLFYTITRWNGEKIEKDYPIKVTATTPTFGGLRWWWICPLIKNGHPCNRRTAKLYLPHNAIYFGCRDCYDLTYTSCKESHKYDDLWWGIEESINRKRGLLSGTGLDRRDIRRLLERLGDQKR